MWVVEESAGSVWGSWRVGRQGEEPGRPCGLEPGRGKTACSPVAPEEEAAAAPHPGTWTMSDSDTSVTQHTRLVTYFVTYIPL